MSSPRHVLILGGNGRISRIVTKILLEKSWIVTGLIRTPEQIDDLKKIGDGLPGEFRIVVHDLEKVDRTEKAKAIIKEVGPDSIVWSAGAGRNSDQDTVNRIDRDAAINFIRAAVATPTISHFILESYLGSRRAKAPWWTDEDWEGWKKVNTTFLAKYYGAKLAADEALVVEARKRSDISATSVRPGGLTDEAEGGTLVGQTKQARGRTSRATTARVTALLLESEKVKTRWLDVLDGDEDAAAGVERCVRDGVECAEGESVYTA